MSKELYKDLIDVGVTYVDVSGKGEQTLSQLKMSVVQIKIWIILQIGDSQL